MTIAGFYLSVRIHSDTEVSLWMRARVSFFEILCADAIDAVIVRYEATTQSRIEVLQ
jgi:hypothetical protein